MIWYLNKLWSRKHRHFEARRETLSSVQTTAQKSLLYLSLLRQTEIPGDLTIDFQVFLTITEWYFFVGQCSGGSEATETSHSRRFVFRRSRLRWKNRKHGAADGPPGGAASGDWNQQRGLCYWPVKSKKRWYTHVEVTIQVKRGPERRTGAESGRGSVSPSPAQTQLLPERSEIC